MYKVFYELLDTVIVLDLKFEDEDSALEYAGSLPQGAKVLPDNTFKSSYPDKDIIIVEVKQ